MIEACGLAVAVERSVWYSYTDPTEDGFGIDLLASDFRVSAAVFGGDPRTGAPVVACADNSFG